MGLGPLQNSASNALQALLSRTYLLERTTFNGIPRMLVMFDAITEETPEFSSTVTEHATEDGTEITDHIQLKNPTLMLKGVISSTPIDIQVAIANALAGAVSAATSSQFRSNFLNTGLSQVPGIAGGALMGNSAAAGAIGGVIDAIARSALLDAWERKARFDVITSRQRYTDMVVESMRFPRSSTTGRALEFELELKHIRTVAPIQVRISTVDEKVVTSATQNTNMGSQAATQTSSQTATKFNGSILKGIFAFAGGG